MIINNEMMKKIEEQYEKKNLIKREHKDFPSIKVYKYSERCRWKGNWNTITETCRDIVIDTEKNEILALPFSKFFNHKQRLEKGLGLLEGSAEITIKLDGIQAVGFYLNNEFTFVAETSFVSTATKEAKRLWEEKYNHPQVDKQLTLMFEVITPKTKVVVDYKKDELVLVGAINKETGEDYHYEKLVQLANELELPVIEKVDITIEEAIEKSETLPYDQEGYVIRVGNERMKVKSKAYLFVFKFTHLWDERNKAEKWAKGELQSLIEELPKEVKEKEMELVKKLEKEKENKINVIKENFEKAPKTSRKEFALWAKKHASEDMPSMFAMLDGKEYVEIVKRSIAENIS